MHLRVELINATDGSTRWSGTFEGDMKDVFLVYDSISRAVAGVLGITVPPTQSSQLARRPTNPVAYDLYLRGRVQRELRNDTAFTAAVEYFRRAIAADSNYSAAYAGLAEASFLRAHFGTQTETPRRLLYDTAQAAALKAVQLDDALPEAHMALGVVRMTFQIDIAAAEAELKRALTLDPANRRTHEYLAILYGLTERPAEGLAEARRAVVLDPLSVTAIREVGRALFNSRRYDEALTELERSRALGPPVRTAPQIIAEVYAKKMMFARAIAELRTRTGLVPTALLGRTLARSGDHAEARRILADLIERTRSNKGGAFFVAVVYEGLGDYTEAFAWLDRSFEDNTIRLDIMDPTFDELRADPRFAQIRKRLGFQKL